MAKYSTELRNARLDAIETIAGTSPILAIMDGSAPANPAAAETGTRLVTMTLPSDWAADASGGTKNKSGTWSDTSADASGTAGYWRLYKSDNITCVAQGSMSELVLDNNVIAAGQQVTISTWVFTEGNA